MCSIMGYCDIGATFSAFEKGFEKTVSRGPDDSKIIDTGKGLLGPVRPESSGRLAEG